MDKLLAVIRREYLERVRERWFVLATVFGPVLFGLLMFAPALIAKRSSQSAADLRLVVIVDGTGTPLGRRIAAELAGGVTGDPDLARGREVPAERLAVEETRARAEVTARRAVGVLTLDPRDLARGEARYAGINATAIGDMRQVERVVREQVLAQRLERAGVPPDRSVGLARSRINVVTEHVTRRQGQGASGEVSSIFALVVAVVLYSSILLYGQMVLRGVMEEKQTRVAEVVLSSISSGKLLAGKVLGVGAVGLTQIALWSVVSYGMFRVRQPILARLGAEASPIVLPAIDLPMAALLVVFFLLGYVLFAALFAVVGAMVSSEQEAQQAQTPIILLLVSSIVVIQPVLVNPDGGLAQVMSVLPFSAPIVMPLRMSMIPLPDGVVVASLLSIAAGAAGAVWLAARVYRVGLLMYGKRPTLGELLRWTAQG